MSDGISLSYGGRSGHYKACGYKACGRSCGYKACLIYLTWLSISRTYSHHPAKKLVGVMLGSRTAQKAVQWSLLT